MQVKLGLKGSDRAHSILPEHPMVAKVQPDRRRPARGRSSSPRPATTAFIPECLVEKGFKLLVLREKEINLEDAFMKITKGQVS